MTATERVLRFFGLFCFCFYMFLLVSYGSLGFWNPGYELSKSYHIDLGSLDSQERSSLFNHVRFLKSYVLGFAAFGIVFRRKVFEERAYNLLFLGTLFVSASGRLLTVLIDGKPWPPMIWFMISEYFFFVCIFAYSRVTLARAQGTKK